MKLERYKDKKDTRRKTLLIGLTLLTLVSITMMLYKTFANFRQEVTFQIMSGKVKIKKVTVDDLKLSRCNDTITATTTASTTAGSIDKYEYQIDSGNWTVGSDTEEFDKQSIGEHTIKVKVTSGNKTTVNKCIWKNNTNCKL